MSDEVARIQDHTERTKALEAAGLSAHSISQQPAAFGLGERGDCDVSHIQIVPSVTHLATALGEHGRGLPNPEEGSSGGEDHVPGCGVGA